MAPEVIRCETLKDDPYDYKADVWSFGKLLYITSIVKVFMLPLAIIHRRHSVFGQSIRGCLSVCVIVSLLTQCIINHLWAFYQIYNFGAFGDKAEVITFRGKRS